MKFILPLALASSSLLLSINAETYFKETFPNGALDSWTQSTSKSDMGDFTLSAGEFYGDEEINQGMLTSQDMKFYGISKKMDAPFGNKDKDLVVQFSVKHEKRETSFCGGGYIKLLPADMDLEKFNGDTEYMIMFGPDVCGYDVNRVHVIFNHEGENLLKDEDVKLDFEEKNEFTHVYTLVVKPDNTYQVLVDGKEKASGELSDDWAFPSKMIDDKTDQKPSDWVEEAEIPDETHVKPEGYDDISEQIVDPEAEKPEDWEDEEDGEWEPPMVDNPDYQGPWEQKMIPNPEYKGVWKPKQVENPDYNPNVYAFENIGAVGFELWVVNGGSVFDNIYVGDSLEEAEKLMEETYTATIEAEKAMKQKQEDEKKAEMAAEAEAAEAEMEADDYDIDMDDEVKEL